MSPGTEPRQSRSRSPSLRPIATRPMLPRLGKRHPRLREPEVDALRQAEEHRRFAKEEGWPAAQRHVADAYAAGIVVPADLTAAKLWYRRAARAMDPDAMLALASLLLPSHISAERIEGLAWALIARDNENVFWFNDAKLETVIAAYRDALVAEDVEKAAAIARDWWRLEWLIHGGGDDEVSRHRAAFKRMLVDLRSEEHTS